MRLGTALLASVPRFFYEVGKSDLGGLYAALMRASFLTVPRVPVRRRGARLSLCPDKGVR